MESAFFLFEKRRLILWKNTNAQLNKGSVFPFYGDSAPFLSLSVVKNIGFFCRKKDLIS